MIATLICTATNAAAARAAQQEAAFTCQLSANGTAPATHYASHGEVTAETLTSLNGLCAITTDGTGPHAVFAAAGLMLVSDPA